ncbi:MAG: Plug domain-containing protein [Gemmatimonadota bacterium]|nr:Plug domain-containing protein [Gemmatimonadota bacterium]
MSAGPACAGAGPLRLAGPAPRRSRCSGGSIHGLLRAGLPAATSAGILLAAGFLSLTAIRPASGQDPPDSLKIPPDSLQVPSDSLQEPPDSVQEPPDSLQAPPDTLQVPPDSLQIPSDTLRDSTTVADSLPAGDSIAADSVDADGIAPPPLFPALPDPAPAAGITGIWEWDRAELLGARGQTLWELLADIPGLILVRSGDFGAATAVFPTGFSGGGLRLYYDGVEHLPLEGSVPDLARIPLSGLERIRVVQRPGGVEVRLFRLVHTDVRAASLVEAGTGDLDTNLLRATFSLPRMFGGKGALAIERLDSRGRDAPGAMTGGWFRYSVHRGDRAGLRYEVRRMASDRTAFNGASPSVKRSDWTLHGRLSLTEDLLAEGWATGASIAPGDTLAVFPFSPESRKQRGASLSGARGPVWGRATARYNEGKGVADRELSLEFSALSDRWGGANGRVWRETWGERRGSGYDVRVWATPHPYGAVFAERGNGGRSVPFLNPPPPEEPEDTAKNGTQEPDSTENADSVEMDPGPEGRFTTRNGTRLGARLRWRENELSVARLWIEADSVRPTGLLIDRDGVVLPQPLRRGWEVTGRFPLRPRGLFLAGEVQFWEETDSLAAPLLYFPDYVYRAGFSFHRTFRATGNFELWVDLGVHGRPEMYVALADGSAPPPADGEEDERKPSMVPFYQNWYFRLQMRFLTLNIFATVENVSFRDNNQDVPGVLLPITRGMYGVRWTFWN